MDKDPDFKDILDENPNSSPPIEDSTADAFILEGDDYEFGDEGNGTADEESTPEDNTGDPEQKKEEKDKDQNQENSSEHNGKYFVIQKGMACCDKGAKFPKFKVTSHKKHYWNDAEGQADYLAVTENDLTFDPAATPFGTCSVKNGNPCAYSPSGKWTKTYEKVKIMGMKPLTEISELMCATGGKITVMKHGQQAEAGKHNVSNADSREQQTYNPIMDFEEFKEEISQSDQLYYE